jgi:PAS domain-containing protein
MKFVNKTKKELIDELGVMRERVCELESHERNSKRSLRNFERRTDQSFSQMTHMNDAVFVLFDRKLEFVNDVFVEIFGISPDDACSSNFDPLSLIAPQSSRFIREQYRKGCCSAFTMQQLNFTGLSKNGLKMECESILLFIPYKWGVAIQGTLRRISASRQIDVALQMSQSYLPVVLSDTVPTGVLYADRDHPLMEATEPSHGFNCSPNGASL